MVRQRRRTLVIMLTNLRDEDDDTLLPALKLSLIHISEPTRH